MLLKVKRALRSLRQVLKSQNGFTMIELAVVLAIIALLAGLAVPTYGNMRRNAVKSEAISKMEEIRVDVWSEYIQTHTWPSLDNDYNTEYWAFTGSSDDDQFTITATGKKAPVDGKKITGVIDTEGKISVGDLVEATN